MQYIKDTAFEALADIEPVIKKLFGTVYFGKYDPSVTFELCAREVLIADDFPLSENPEKFKEVLVYVAFPLDDKIIDCVWPGTADEFRYSTASIWVNDCEWNINITPAAVIRKENVVLYLCLNPEGEFVRTVECLRF